MNTRTPQRYRVPTVLVDQVVSLDEFDVDDIRMYLAHEFGDKDGYSDEQSGGGSPDGGIYIWPNDADRISTLLLCGQRDAAREFLFKIVERAIGRKL